jgi:pimeloyl-ACP methyl ester carboxylesterase
VPNTYHRVGNGPHGVIALHGWFGDRHAFAAMEDALSHTEFSYAFMDCRGYGDLMKDDGPFTMEQVAADALDLADALGWNTFSLVGHSMGGKAIQRVLTRAPERVRKLVGVTPVPASGVPFDEAGRALFEGAVDKAENRYAIIDFTTGNRLTPAWIHRRVDYSLAHSTRAAFAAYLRAWAQDDFCREIRGRPHPVHVIVGAHDPALGAAVMQDTFLAWYPHATMEVMANAGHYPMDETPVALVTAIEAFLRKP